MQLLKKREFGDYINDTFHFLRENGRHYFKNYLLVNGAPIVLFLIILYYTFSSLYGLSTFDQNIGEIVVDLFKSNVVLSIILLLFIVLLILVFGLLQYAYSTVYLLLYQRKNTNFSARDIFHFIFVEKWRDLIIFFLVSLLLLIPVSIVLLILILVFAISIVGVFIPIAGVSLWFSMAFISYLSDEKDVFQSFGYAWNLLFVKFWKNVGAVAVFMVLTLVVDFGVSLVLNALASLASFNTIEASDKSFIVIFAFIISFIISKAISLLLQNINQLLQNIVYFSIKESRENINSSTEIEQIGEGE